MLRPLSVNLNKRDSTSCTILTPRADFHAFQCKVLKMNLLFTGKYQGTFLIVTRQNGSSKETTQNPDALKDS
jgi:hypothetical protein